MAAKRGPRGKVGEFGYKEFDSRDFQDGKSSDDDDSDEETESESTDDAVAGDAEPRQGAEATDTEKPEETDDDDSKEDDDVEGDTEDEDDGEGSETEEQDAKGDEKPEAYKANTKFTVYDKEMEFPKELLPVVKDKASEDFVRDLLTRAHGLDGMKIKHQEIVRDRDQQKVRGDSYQEYVGRVNKLRETNPWLFFREVGVSDALLLRAARELTDHHDPENPQARATFDGMRQAQWDAHVQGINNQNATRSAESMQREAHDRAMASVLEAPHVSTFAQRFDQMKGAPGSFKRAVEAHGFQAYSEGRGNLSPMQAAQEVIDFWSKGMPADTTPAAAAKPKPGDKAAAKAVPPGNVRERPRGLVTGGRGRAASPVGEKKPKTIKEMKEKAKRELARMGE